MLRIAIAGAGIAGLTAAILLARNGHEICIFERQRSLEGIGGGLLLQPCGLDVLAHVGLLTAATERGARIDRIIRRHRSGRITADLSYRELRAGLHGLGIKRSTLLELLIQATAVAGVQFVAGVEIAGVDDTVSSVRLQDPAGHSCGHFDVLVVADGMRSHLRKSLGVPAAVSDCGWGVWSVCAPMPPQLDHHAVVQQFDRGLDVTGLLPSGRDSRNVEHVTWFQNVPLSGSHPTVSIGFEQWRRNALLVCPEATPILEPIRTFEELQLSRYAIISMPRWYGSLCVAIGDAAHALDPRIGMGANMALADAAALADSMTNARADQLSTSFRSFDQRRRLQVERYQKAARYLPALFEAQGRFASAASEATLRASLLVPAVRRGVIAAMSGFT